MPQCGKCSYKLLKSWQFCPKCGTKNTDTIAYPLRLVEKTGEPLTAEDWTTILSLAWEPDLRNEIYRLYEEDNEPLEYLDLYASRINEVFMQHRFCYRVMVAKYGGRRIPARSKIYKTIPRRG
jgi:hypothetical protein